MPSEGMTDTASLHLLLARWLEARLHDSVDFSMRGCRLYGLEVIDPAGLAHGDPLAARMSFVADADDIVDMVRLPEARRALEFDAAAIVTVEWRMVDAAGPMRPRAYPVRKRARVVDVRNPDGGAVVLRFENEPELVVLAIAS